MSQLTTIALQHFRAKRAKHHSQINLSRPYIIAKIRRCSTEMIPRHEKNGASTLVQKHLSYFDVSGIIERIWELIANALRASAQ